MKYIYLGRNMIMDELWNCNSEDVQDYVKDFKKRILSAKKKWYNELSKNKKFKVYDSNSYGLRLYSEDKELIRRTYDRLCNNVWQKIVVNIVDDVNLVFSVSDNISIENAFFTVIDEVTSKREIPYDTTHNGNLDNLKDTDDGTPLIEVYEESKPEDGIFRKYWSNGNLRYEWEYKDGKRADGISRGWWYKGNIKHERTSKDGKLDGFFARWYENGNKDEEGTWKNGKMVGKWTWYYENGQKLKEATYKDGKMLKWGYVKRIK